MSAARADIVETDALSRDGRVWVRWRHSVDPYLSCFWLERLNAKAGTFDRLAADPVEAGPILDEGLWHEVADPEAMPGQTHTYRVVAVNVLGQEKALPAFMVCAREVGASRVSALAITGAGQAGGAPPLTVQSSPGARLKVHVEQTGMVEIPVQSLADNLAGETVNSVVQRIAEGQFRVSCGTNEVAWTAAGDNTGLVFFVTALDSIYTRQNVYWIDVGPGTRMDTDTPASPEGVGAGSFQDQAHIEYDLGNNGNYGIFTDPESDIWFWVRMAAYTNRTTVTNLIVNLPSALPGAGWVRANLKGSSTVPTSPPHHARIYLNGQLLGTADWMGYDVFTTPFPATHWLAGTNTVTLEGYAQAGEPHGTYFFLDSLDVSFPRLFQAFSNSLACASETNAVLAVDGFTRGDIRIFDVTVPERPVVVTGPGVVVDSPSNGNWRVTFAPSGAGRQYRLVAGPLAGPAAVTGRPRVTLEASPHRAAYVVLYHALVADGALALVDYRQSQGLQSLGVDIEDVYDAFSGGVVTPHAIRRFLAYARLHWVQPPELAALAGSGNMDYRNLRNMTNDGCLIPPVMIPDNGAVGLVGCDMPLGDTDGDGVPEVVIGRLPAQNGDQMWAMVGKIMAAEAAASNVAIVSLVADANDIGSLGPEQGDFAANSDRVGAMIGAHYLKETNYGLNLASAAMTNVKERFIAQLNQPRTLLTYTGHANNTGLGNGKAVLADTDLPRLTNAVPSLLLAMTCQFANFSLPFTISADNLAELMVRKATGGVVGVWSAAASSYSSENTRLGEWVVKSGFRANGARFGTALKEGMVAYARQPGHQPWILSAYVLLGDPALDLGFLNGEPATYAAWSQAVFTPEQQADPAVSGPDADPDRDGLSNQQEYAMGTTPTDPGSGLRITAFDSWTGGRHAIRWPGVSNRVYALDWSTNGLATFQTRADYLWATDPVNVYTDVVDEALSPVFYRVRLRGPP